jgi:hypothetical protein
MTNGQQAEKGCGLMVMIAAVVVIVLIIAVLVWLF